jgi:aminoglycoside phosphotransferase (APT) family kinase protein
MVVLKLEAAVNLLSQFRPSAGEKLSSLFDLLAASAGRIGARPVAMLHGDLHMKNFLVAGDRVALIDLDNLCRGDPLQDAGSFVAALYYQGLLEGRPSHLIERTAQQFIESYRMNAGVGIAEPALDWYTAAALIYERAYRCVTRLKAIRLEILDDIIELASRFSTRI